MNIDTPEIISELADACGGTIREVGIHPGGESGFATMSLPLPEDHWLYETDANGFSPKPEYKLLVGAGTKTRRYLEDLLMSGIKYGIKGATMNGREDDFDPDALARNVLIGQFGVYTSDGLSHLDGHLFNPETPGSLPQELVRLVALAVSDGLVTPEEITHAISQQGVEAAVEVYNTNEAQKQAEYRALCERKGWACTEDQAVGFNDLTIASEDTSHE